MSVDQVDPVVRAALRRLPVPDHEPGFWERLDAAIAEQAPVAELVERRVPPVRPITVPPPADHPHPAALRGAGSRRSTRVLAVATVAAAGLVVWAASGLVRSQTTSDEVDTAASTTEPGQTGDEGERSSGSATLQQPEGSQPGGPSTAIDTVDAWLLALGEGDTAAAWELLGPAAKGHWDSEQAFAAESSALAEGYGAWAGITPDIVVATSLGASGDGSIEVVTLVADVAQEGTIERRVLALPVRITAEGARIEPSPVSAGIQPIDPPSTSDAKHPPVLRSGGQLAVGLPAGCAAPALRVDAAPAVVPGETDASTLSEGSAGVQVAAYRPTALTPGEHVLTAACIHAESGTIFALARLFEVE